ncbi:MAG: hypothetical protein ACRCZD_17325 [Phycicoccus sp.]
MHGDPSLRDEQLQHEIELVAELVLAALQTDGPLSQERIDAVLGVTTAPDDVVPPLRNDAPPVPDRAPPVADDVPPTVSEP